MNPAARPLGAEITGRGGVDRLWISKARIARAFVIAADVLC
jgi:hypothetical protein